ncbi:hypothetical protein R1flu_029236 [Riccia fluitans]|uniref:Uncharacterized protein n=1 Tax=Riccia fluitans TaxID=41844 RepID=A0ABD1XT16_9MARC
MEHDGMISDEIPVEHWRLRPLLEADVESAKIIVVVDSVLESLDFRLSSNAGWNVPVTSSIELGIVAPLVSERSCPDTILHKVTARGSSCMKATCFQRQGLGNMHYSFIILKNQKV